MFSLHPLLVAATAPRRKPLPQDALPMHAPAKPVLPPCRRPRRWHLRTGRPWAVLPGPSLAPT